MRVDFDVVIVGGGPAGALCAYELKKLKPDLKILILEKGGRRAIDDTKNNLFGWLGAGAFSDGKLTLTSKTGGQLIDGYLADEEFTKLMKYVESLFERFGGKQELKIGDEAKIRELIRRANAAGLELIPYPIKHWGREGAYKIAENLYKHLKRKKVEILLNSEVVSIEKDSERWGVVLKNRKKYWSNHLILATGRAGADWTVKQLGKFGVETENNPADVGIRIEVKKSMMEELTSQLYDFKLVYLTERRDRVRTFCVCPGGRIVKEQHANFCLVNGQTDKSNQTENTNFAILVSISLTEPYDDANQYGRDLAHITSELGAHTVMVQTLADWQNKRRSKPESLRNFPVKSTLPEASPGDIRGLALTERPFAALDEMIKVLGKFIPGLSVGNNVLLYAPEDKFYSKKVVFETGFETKAKGLYVVGDGSGVTRGLAQSTIMGIKTARDIAEKID